MNYDLTNNKVKRLAFGALATAMICISTMFHIPIPLGYMHLGNVFILVCGFLFPWDISLFAAGFGSAMADLLSGYPQWILPTLFIKCIMGAAVSWSFAPAGPIDRPAPFSLRSIFAVIVGILIMILGYTIAGSLLYASLYTGLTQLPGLCTEGIFGIVGFFLIAPSLGRCLKFS